MQAVEMPPGQDTGPAALPYTQGRVATDISVTDAAMFQMQLTVGLSFAQSASVRLGQVSSKLHD